MLADYDYGTSGSGPADYATAQTYSAGDRDRFVLVQAQACMCWGLPMVERHQSADGFSLRPVARAHPLHQICRCASKRQPHGVAWMKFMPSSCSAGVCIRRVWPRTSSSSSDDRCPQKCLVASPCPLSRRFAVPRGGSGVATLARSCHGRILVVVATSEGLIGFVAAVLRLACGTSLFLWSVSM